MANAGIPVAMNALVPGSGMADMFIRNAGTGLARGIVNSPNGGPQRVGGPGSPEGAMPTRKFGSTRETVGELKSGFKEWLADPLQAKKERKEQERDIALAVRLGITGAEYSLIHRPAMSLIKKRTGDVQTNLMILQFRVQQFMARHLSAIASTMGVNRAKLGHEEQDPNRSWFGHLLTSIHKDLQENKVFSTLESIGKHAINLGRILNPLTIASRTQKGVKRFGEFIQRLALGKEGFEMMRDPNRLYEKAGLKQDYQTKSVNLMKINNEYQKLQLNMLYNVVGIGEQLLNVFGVQYKRQELDITHDEYDGTLKSKKQAAIDQRKRDIRLGITQMNAARRHGFLRFLAPATAGVTNLVKSIHSSINPRNINSLDQAILSNLYDNINPAVLRGLTPNLTTFVDSLTPADDFRKDKDKARDFKLLLLEALNTDFSNKPDQAALQQELRNSWELSARVGRQMTVSSHAQNIGTVVANSVSRITGHTSPRMWLNEHIHKQRAYERYGYDAAQAGIGSGSYQEELLSEGLQDSITRKILRAFGGVFTGIAQQYQLGSAAVDVDAFLRRGAEESNIPTEMGYGKTSGTPGQKLNLTASTVITDIEDTAVKAIQRHRLLVSIANLRKEVVDKLKALDFRSKLVEIDDAAVNKIKQEEYKVRVHDFDQEAIDTIKNNSIGGTVNSATTYSVKLVSVDQSITTGLTTLVSTLSTDINRIINTDFVSNLRNLGEELIDINLKNAAADLIDNNLKRVMMAGVHELVGKYFYTVKRWNNNNPKEAYPVVNGDPKAQKAIEDTNTNVGKLPQLLSDISDETEKTRMAIEKIAGVGTWASGGTFLDGNIGNYENRILTKPTFFNYNKIEKFAQGGTVGVAGEGRRAEGVLPLERNEDGDLGVNAVGGLPTIATTGIASTTKKAIAAVLVDIDGKPSQISKSASISTNETRREKPLNALPPTLSVSADDDHVKTAAERERDNQEKQEKQEEGQRNERQEKNEEEKKTLLQKIADFLDPRSKINKLRELANQRKNGGFGLNFGFLGSILDFIPGFVKTIGMTILGTQLMKLLPDQGKGLIKKVGGMLWDSITFIGGKIWELIEEHGPGLAEDTWKAIKEHPWLTAGTFMTMFPGTVGTLISKVAIPILKKNPLAAPIVLGVGGMIYNFVDTIQKGKNKKGEFDVPTFLSEFLVGSGSGIGRILGKVGTWGTIGATIGAAFGGIGAIPGFLLGSAVGYIIGDTKSTNDKGEFDMTVFLKNLLLGNEKQGGANNALKQAGKWATIGAMAGIPFGPIGMVAGSLLGGAVGGIAGFIGSDKFDAYWSKTDSGKEIAAKFGFKQGSMAYDMAMSPTANKLPYVGPFIWGWLGYLVDLGESIFKETERAIARLNPWKKDPVVEEYKNNAKEKRKGRVELTEVVPGRRDIQARVDIPEHKEIHRLNVTEEDERYINAAKDDVEKKHRMQEIKEKYEKMDKYADEAKFKYRVNEYVDLMMRRDKEEDELKKKYPRSERYHGQPVPLTDSEYDEYQTLLYGKTKGTPQEEKTPESLKAATEFLSQKHKDRSEEQANREKKLEDAKKKLEIGGSPEGAGGPSPAGSSIPAAMEAKEQSQARDKESGGGKDDDLPDVGSLPIMQMAEEYTKYANEHQGEKLEKFTPDWKSPKDDKPKSPSSAPAAAKANREAGGDDGDIKIDLPLLDYTREYSKYVEEQNANGKKAERFTEWTKQKEGKVKNPSSAPAAMKAKKKNKDDDAPPDVSSLPIIQMSEEYSRLAKENPGKELGRFTPDWKPPTENEPTKSMGSIPATKSIGNAPIYKSFGNTPVDNSIGEPIRDEIGGEPDKKPWWSRWLHRNEDFGETDPEIKTHQDLMDLARLHTKLAELKNRRSSKDGPKDKSKQPDQPPKPEQTPPQKPQQPKPEQTPPQKPQQPKPEQTPSQKPQQPKPKQTPPQEAQPPKPDQPQPQPQPQEAQPQQETTPPAPQEQQEVQHPGKLNWIESLISQAIQNAFRIGGTIFDLGKRAIDRLGDGPADVQAPWGDKLPYGGRFGFIAIDKECKGNIADVTHEDDGSYSYGLYQFNSGRGGKTGTMQRFMVYLKEKHPALYAPLKDKTVGSSVFNEAYKKVAKENEKQMGDAQEEFLKVAYYQPALNEVGKNSGGSDLIKRFGQNRAFQEMLVSTAIQHGPGGARSIFRDAWNRLSEDQKKADEKTTLTALIKAVYDERGKESRFPTVLSTKKTAAQRANFMNSMRNRYASESQMVLALLSGGRPQGNHGDIGKPGRAFPGYPKISQEVLSGWKIPSSEPLIWPAQSSVITSPMGRRPQPPGGGSIWHEGIDVRAPLDAPIYAAMSGQVIGVGQKLGTVKIRHSNGWETRYLHLNRFNVKQGDSVRAGQLIGGSGNIGSSGRPNAGWYPHLHFEMHKDGKLADPEGVFYQYSKGGGHSAYDRMQYKPGVQQYQKLSSKMGGGDSGVKPSGVSPKLSSSKIPMFPRLSDKLEVGGDSGFGGDSIRTAIGNFFGKSQPKAPTPPSTGIISKPSTIDFESGGDDSRSTKIRTSVTEYLNDKTAGGSGKNIGESIINELKSVKVLIAALIKTSNRPVVAVAPAAPVNDNPKNRMVDDDGSSDLASNNMFSQIGGILPNLNVATTGLGTTIS